VAVIDSGSLPPGTTVRADVAIIGSGPAGLTVALGLLDAGIEVVVLESGGDTWTPDGHALGDGDVVGGRFIHGEAELGVADVRMRALGGSSGHWAGMCRPLDPIDLRARAEIDRWGWPIDDDELGSWYRLAQQTCEIGPFGYDAREWYATFDQEPPLDSDVATTALYRFSPPTRFGERYRPDLEAAERCTVVLHATVVGLVPTPDGRHVERIDVRRPDGEGLTVEAGLVVLATGGIDVPRMLLSSTGADPAGLANRSGLVGIGFMEHPHVRLGRFSVSLDATAPSLRPHKGRGRFAGWSGLPAFHLVDDVLAERGLPSAALTFERPDALPDTTGSAPGDVGAGVEELLEAMGDPVTTGAAMLRAEQYPLARNRVGLSSRRDALGMPLPEVRWTVDRSGFDELITTVELLADELARAGVARLELSPGPAPLTAADVEIGCHHMGTARMSEDPGTGVVDRDGLCHDVDNLYVAGSAVFPTGGYANPTLTIVALAHRLADTISRRLTGRATASRPSGG
jgi:choline dehydrogenase-like flavoprotein